MRAIALFIAIPIILIAVIVGIGRYLGPDDLAQCTEGPSETEARCFKADAIVAISGGDTNARVTEAVRLYRDDWADKLIFSGAAIDEESPSNASTMKRIAMHSGVPESAITIEESARDTSENALNTSLLASFEGNKRMILVTSAYHQRRASMEFKQVFGDKAQIINHPVQNDKHWSSMWWLTPRGWWLAIGELAKIMVVLTRGSMI
jgi:uncharacterized SAM-binding protein YcdF (DUF218 family)